MALIGTNVTAPAATSSFRLGSRNVDESGNEFVYVHANGAITGAGYTCAIDSAYEATMVSTSNDLANNWVGVPLAAFADNDYGWLQIRGTGSVRVANGALKDVSLNTTGTAGLIDDDATAGAFKITGLYLVATASSGPSNWACVLNYPALAAVVI
jgi:hypothetical protein